MITIIIVIVVITHIILFYVDGTLFNSTPLAYHQDSSKGGAVETGCSGLHSIIGCFFMYYYLHPLHPPPTAPPCNEYPDE